MDRSLRRPAAGDLRGLEWAGGAVLAIAGGYLAGAGAHLLLALLLAAVVGLLALSRPGPFLLAYLAYMPFEEFILKWVPEGTVYLALRFGPELALYAMLGGLLLRRAATGRRPIWRRTPADLPLLAFLAIAIVSALVSGGPWLLAAHGMRWLLRYLVVYYLVVHLDWDAVRTRRWMMALLGVAVAQSAIAAVQSLVGQPAWDFLAPDYSKRAWATDVVKWDPEYHHGVFATMGSYFALGNFLGLWTALCLAWRWTTGRRGYGVAALFLGAGLLLSYSRQAALALLVGAAIASWILGRRRLVALCLILALAYFGVGAWVWLADVSIPTSDVDRPLHERFLGPFSREYWRIDYTFFGRSYLLFDVGGRLIADAPLLGEGPGMFGTRASLLYHSPVYERLKIDTRNLFDVYWVDVLGQVGLLGLATFVVLLLRLGAAARRRARQASDPWERGLSLGFTAVLAGAMVASFFGPSLSDRYLSLYVWFLAGLATRPEAETPCAS